MVHLYDYCEHVNDQVQLRSESGMMRTVLYGTYTGIIDGTIGSTWWDWGIVGMLNWRAGPERLMGVAGGAGTTGGKGRAPAIVGFFSWNREHACSGWRIAALYWFEALLSKRYYKQTGNVEVAGVPDAWAWTVAEGRAGGGMNNDL